MKRFIIIEYTTNSIVLYAPKSMSVTQFIVFRIYSILFSFLSFRMH